MSLNTEYKNSYAFGYVSPNDKCSSNKKNVVAKVLGYIPFVGTFVGIGRVYVTIKSHGNNGFTARHLTRSLIESTSFGSVLIIPDVAISAFRHFSKEKAAYVKERDQEAQAQGQRLLEVLTEAKRVFAQAQQDIPYMQNLENALCNPYKELEFAVENLRLFLSEPTVDENKKTRRARQAQCNSYICNAAQKIAGMSGAILSEIKKSDRTNAKVDGATSQELALLQGFSNKLGEVGIKLMSCQIMVR